MGDHQGWRSVEWEGRVRFRVPPGWIAGTERAEGHDVALFHPPDGGAGVLRVLADARTPRPGEAAAAVLHEMAMRFVRPDDSRVADRTVERRADGATVAMAVLVDGGDAGGGGPETHYLWFLGADRGGVARVAMFSVALPAALDGQEPYAGILAGLDAAVRDAVLT